MAAPRRAPSYIFAFKDSGAALRFVQRLVFTLGEVAVCRNGEHVIVIDGSAGPDRRAAIMQLARESSASIAVAKD